MKALLLTSAVIAATTLTSLAQANSAIINFTGNITAATCTINGASGSAVAPANLNIDLGTVSADTITSAAGSTVTAGAQTSLPIALECGSATGLTSVAVQFTPHTGSSGIDRNDGRLLQTTGTATGVGIGLIDADNSLINMSGTALSQPVALDVDAGTSVGSASFVIRAAYIKSGTAAITPGSAEGVLPFTLSYM